MATASYPSISTGALPQPAVSALMQLSTYHELLLTRHIVSPLRQAYLYDGYWEDIGTIESFYLANLALTKDPNPNFRCLSDAARRLGSAPLSRHAPTMSQLCCPRSVGHVFVCLCRLGPRRSTDFLPVEVFAWQLIAELILCFLHMQLLR